MTKRTRWNHSPGLKANVALVAVKGEKTLVELAQQLNVHPNQITTWRGQLLEGAVGVDHAADRRAAPGFLFVGSRMLHDLLAAEGNKVSRLHVSSRPA